MKKIFISLLLSLFISANAQCNCCYVPSTKMCPNHQGFKFFGEFLYLKTSVDNLTYTLVASFLPNVAANTTTEIDLKEIDFDWDPAFRVGIGYDFPYDGWDAILFYTYLRTTPSATTSVDPNNDSIFVAALYAEGAETTPISEIPLGKTAKANWKLTLNSLDFLMGRNSRISESLTFKPLFGFQTVWLDQTLKTVYSNIQFPVVEADKTGKNDLDFWGIGPKFGLESRFMVSFFGLFGKIYGSGLYGEFDAKDVEGNVTINANPNDRGTLKTKHSFYRLRPIFQGIFGFDFEKYFSNNILINFSAGYEIQYWFSFEEAVVPNINPFNNRGDLSFNGLNLSLKLDF